MSQTSIELRQDITHEEGPSNLDLTGTTEFSSLPPVDTGKDAWLFLAASFMVEALIWGEFTVYLLILELTVQAFHLPLVFFRIIIVPVVPLKGHRPSRQSVHAQWYVPPKISIYAHHFQGILYLGLPVMMTLQRLYPSQSRHSPIIGLFIMCIAFALSSFSQNTTHLILTQGILYAIGGSISYCPCLLYLDQWFARRKGLAYGVMWSGTGLAGFALPLIFEKFLHEYGFRTTLRIWSLSLFILTLPLAYFIKPRLPHSATRHINPLKLVVGLARSGISPRQVRV